MTTGLWRGRSGELVGARRLVGRVPTGWRWPLGLSLVSVASYLLWLPYLDAPLDDDAAGYATAAYWWGRGDTLYRDITITRPQGIFVVFRLLQAVGLGSVRGIHVAAALTCIVALLILAVVARRLWGAGIALGAAAAFGGLMAAPYLQGPTANAELFMLPPLLASLYALLRAGDWSRGRFSDALVLAAGLLGAFAALIKPAAVTTLLFGLAWLAWHGVRVGGRPREHWRAAALFGGGFALGVVVALVHGLLTVPDIYLEAVLFYRLGNDSVLGSELGLGHTLSQIGGSLFVIVAGIPLLLIGAYGLWAARVDPCRRRRDILLLWLLASAAGIALGGNWFPHYYQQAAPPLAIGVALGLRAVLRQPPGSWRGLLRGLGAGVVIQLVIVVALAFTLSLDEAAARLGLNHQVGRATTDALVDYLESHTAQDDTIYVAYQQVDLYYLSGRRPATRWMYGRELLWGAGAFDAQVARLADPARAPRYIVGVQAFDFFGGDPHGAMREAVAREYFLDTQIDGVSLYRHR